MNIEINPDKLRIKVLEMVYSAKSGHIGGSFSLAELCAYLYSKYSLVSPEDLNSDVLILSKGHAVPILYAALNLLGKISDDELKTFREIDSRLQGHPHCLDIPELHASTGSLGQGLSIAIGRAIAKKKLGHKGRVFCILGDGEMQEGQVWETAMFSSHHDLSNFCAIIDYNKMQSDNLNKNIINLEPLAKKWNSFGWNVIEINGHSFSEIQDSIKKF